MSDMVVLQGVPFGKDICLMISGYASCAITSDIAELYIYYELYNVKVIGTYFWTRNFLLLVWIVSSRRCSDSRLIRKKWT